MEAMESLAEHLWPGERIRRGHRVYDIERAAVTYEGPVVLTVRRVNGTAPVPAEAEELSFPWGEIIRRVEI